MDKPIIKRISMIAAIIIVIGLIFLADLVNSTIPKDDPTHEDIYYHFLEGERLVNGINPYERILGGDTRTNQKYPTYFPLFYEIAFLSQKMGLSNFESWIHLFQKFFIWFEYLIALLLFAVMAAKNFEWGGVIAAGFWLFNRWTLYIITSINFDFIPILFMLLGFVLFPRRKWLAMVFFSISLALKQIGIFVAPLFVIWTFIAEDNFVKGIKQAVKCGFVIASVPFISSIPFLFWSLTGFIQSIAFSAARLADTHINLKADSVDFMMGWVGLPARIPMLILLLAIYWMAAKGIGKRYLPAVLIFIIFISFNAVLYNQYFTWLIALIPLLILDYVKVPDNYSLKLLLPHHLIRKNSGMKFGEISPML